MQICFLLIRRKSVLHVQICFLLIKGESVLHVQFVFLLIRSIFLKPFSLSSLFSITPFNFFLFTRIITRASLSAVDKSYMRYLPPFMSPGADQKGRSLWKTDGL